MLRTRERMNPKSPQCMMKMSDIEENPFPMRPKMKMDQKPQTGHTATIIKAMQTTLITNPMDTK